MAESAARIARELWDRIDRRDWDGMAALLHPDLVARWPHTGETFDAAGLVAVNRDYPGQWRVRVEDVVAGGDRAAVRAFVTNGDEVAVAASFVTVRDGRIAELVEVWSDTGMTPPAGRRPGG